ncbi:MAG: asparagine synthase (glutamine-hydrolyzing) [Pseudomonadota bacterium]
MCGIFALINPPGLHADRTLCRAATNLLIHRGPDAHGEWSSREGDIFLGHRRLSILDVSERSNQPMISERGNVLVYNGEIYNFRELRRNLEARGCRFKTTGDTEVLLHALEVWGKDCLTKLEGMFAFLFWSPSDETALIARDPFGIKPLYYRHLPTGSLTVASEMKSLYAVPGFSPRLASDFLPEQLAFRSLSGDRTLLSGVMSVQAGELIVYRRPSTDLVRQRYWTPRDLVTERIETHGKRLTEQEFLSSFKQIVDRHLIADVPLGTQFSGGVDSSLVCAMACRELGRDLTGFHCHVTESDYDETPFAEETANLLGMRLETENLNGEIFFSDLLDRLTFHSDEPLAHPNSLGIYLVSRAAYGKVKVLLSGEAADEFFAGYIRYRMLLLQRWFQRFSVPAPLFRAIEPAFHGWTRPLDTLLEIAGKAVSSSIERLIISGTAFMRPDRLQGLLNDDKAWDKACTAREPQLEETAGLDLLTRCRLYDVATYLPPIFMRQDKMSMAASIETRVPFAVPEVLAMALRLPPHELCTLFAQKRFLKRCLGRFLPRRLVHRTKGGFGLPLARWFMSSAGRERLHELAASGSPLEGIVDMGFVRPLVENFDGDRDRAEELWNLLSLAAWAKIFLGSTLKPTNADNGGIRPYGSFVN